MDAARGASFASDQDEGSQRGSRRPIPPLVPKIQVTTTNEGAKAQGGLTPDFLALSHQVKRLLHRDLARLHGFCFWQRNGQYAIVDFRADSRHIDRWIKFVDAPEIVRLDLPIDQFSSEFGWLPTT